MTSRCLHIVISHLIFSEFGICLPLCCLSQASLPGGGEKRSPSPSRLTSQQLQRKVSTDFSKRTAKSGCKFMRTWPRLHVHLWNHLSGQRVEYVSGPRSDWWLGLPPTKPYGQKVDDSQRKTGLLKLEDTMHDGKAKTTDPPQNPHEIHFRMSPAKPSHLHSPTDVLVGGQNGEVYSLNHSPKGRAALSCCGCSQTCRNGRRTLCKSSQAQAPLESRAGWPSFAVCGRR